MSSELDPAVMTQLEEAFSAALNASLQAAPGASSAQTLRAIAAHLKTQADVLRQQESGRGSAQEEPARTIGGAGAVAPQAQATSTASNEVQHATDDSFAKYDDYEELLRTVESGAIAPLKGSYVLKLYESGGRIKRRQEMPPEAFWTAAELRAIVEAARRHFGDDREAARAAQAERSLCRAAPRVDAATARGDEAVRARRGGVAGIRLADGAGQ